MTRIPGRTLCLLALSCSVWATAEAAPDDLPNELVGRIEAALDPALEAYMREHQVPGVALALTDGASLVLTRNWGYADLKANKPVTDDTLFQIGSITKSFTALALLAAEEEGLVDLNKPVVDYLPWFAVHTQYAPLTAHDLLTHTAGIPGNRDDIFSSPYMAVALAEQHTAWPPGERYYYSNVGYQVLHVLLTAVTGEDYEDIVREQFFEPLGMDRSKPSIRLDSRARQAIGYITPYDDRPAHPSRPLVEAPFHEYAIGDGCIQATAADLAAYVRLWLNRGATPAGRVVSAKAFDAFSSIHPGTTDPDAPEDGYGYGVRVVARDNAAPMLSHSGGMVGHYAYAGADLEEGRGVAVLVNGPGSATEIGELALAAWRAIESGDTPPGRPVEPLPTIEPAEYAGRYRAGDGSALVVEAIGRDLVVVRGDDRILLEPRDEDVFYTPEPGLDRYLMHFGRDEAGEVVELTHGADWYVNSRYRGETAFDVPADWQALAGRYRNFSPWFSYFEVLVHKDGLWVFTGEGGETESGVTRLVPLGSRRFRVGEDEGPEILEFHDIVDGKALRASYSGHPFFRQ